jgi:hypothetical protein
LTGRIFEHPVLTKQGHHYERSALINLFNNGMGFRDPMTGQSIVQAAIITDVGLMNRIKIWKTWKYEGTYHDGDEEDECHDNLDDEVSFFALSSSQPTDLVDVCPPADDSPPAISTQRKTRFRFGFAGRAA